MLAAVLRERLDQLAQAVSIDPQRVPEYAGELFDYHTAYPDVVRLVLWEALSSTGNVVDEPDRTTYYQGKVEALREAQQIGTVDAQLDPRLTVLAILGLVNWQFAATQITRMLLAGETNRPSRDEQRAFLVEAVRRLIQSH